MNEVFDRTMFLEMANYNNDPREYLKQAVKELVSDRELQDIYNINVFFLTKISHILWEILFVCCNQHIKLSHFRLIKYRVD